MGLILDPPLDDASHRTVRGGSLEAEACARALVDEILGSNESDPSIYGVIASRLPEQAGLNALRPGPEVDAALGRLVALLVSRFGHRDTGPDHWDVVRSACRLIESDPARLQRARSVRRAAGHAESLMEVHHADLLLADSDHHSRAHGDPMRSLRQLLRSFPYLPNYVSLVEAELAGFKRLGSADRMAFCGAGALPLTAILWHLSTGIAITAVEVDPSVAHLAERVIQRLVRKGVLDAGALTVEVADAAELDAQRFQLIAVASLVPTKPWNGWLDRWRNSVMTDRS